MNKWIFKGRVGNDTVYVTVVDLATFVNASPREEVFVTYENGGQGSVRKSAVVWDDISEE